MKNIARLVGFLSFAIFAVGLVASASASASVGYLLLPVGGLVLGLSLPGTLKSPATGNAITCEHDSFEALIASVHLVGPFQVHFLGCFISNAKKEVCTAKSTSSSTEGLILTNTLHALIGLGLPGGLPAVLFLPTSGKIFVTIASTKCNEEGKITGTVAGLLLAPVNQLFQTALLDFRPGDPQSIDLPLGGTVEPEITLFSARAEFETTVHLTFDPWALLMP